MVMGAYCNKTGVRNTTALRRLDWYGVDDSNATGVQREWVISATDESWWYATNSQFQLRIFFLEFFLKIRKFLTTISKKESGTNGFRTNITDVPLLAVVCKSGR